MALEVTVGPPVVTINHGDTFLVSALDGSIASGSDHGLYSRDTRYLSRSQLYIEGQPWTLLNAGAVAYYASRTYLVNPHVRTEQGEIAPHGSQLKPFVGQQFPLPPGEGTQYCSAQILAIGRTLLKLPSPGGRGRG